MTAPRNAAECIQQLTQLANKKRPWLVTATRSLSYAELNDFIEQVAGAKAEFGWQSGDRVVLISADAADCALLFVALVLNGLTVVNLDAQLGTPRALALLRKVKPVLLIADQAILARLPLTELAIKRCLPLVPASNPKGLAALLKKAPPRLGLHAVLAKIEKRAPATDFP